MIQSLFSGILSTVFIVVGIFVVIFFIAYLLFKAWEQIKIAWAYIKTLWYWFNNSDPNNLA